MSSAAGGAVVVAGPGGAGKSTFISLLSAGALPDEIRALLPEGADSWPALMPGVFRKPRGLDPPAGRYVLHYDTTGPARKWGLDYSADPALAGLSTAHHVTVVDIRPARGSLIGQLEHRSTEAEANRSLVSKIWHRLSLRTLLQPRKTLRRFTLPTKLDLYRQTGWLEQVYASWDAYLQALQSRTEMLVIRVEPYQSNTGQPSFRLVECRNP